MWNREKKKYCCVSGTYYNIFLFCLVADFLDNTIFFTSPNIDCRDENFYYYHESKRTIMKFFNVFRNYSKFRSLRKKYSSEGKEILFVQDHVISFYTFLRGKKYFLLEDGLTNYRDTDRYFEKEHSMSPWRRRIRRFIGRLSHLGVSSQAEKIFLRGLLDVPNSIKDKVELIDIHALWKQKSKEEKKWINHFFQLKEEDMRLLQQKKIILFTQSLSEDGILSEKEKIDVYSNILENYKKEEVLIKLHPREVTDYASHFPQIVILQGIAPIELYLLNGLRIDTAITLFSTAVYGLKEEGTEIIFYGTGVHPKIKKRFGSEDFGMEFKKIKN